MNIKNRFVYDSIIKEHKNSSADTCKQAVSLILDSMTAQVEAGNTPNQEQMDRIESSLQALRYLIKQKEGPSTPIVIQINSSIQDEKIKIISDMKNNTHTVMLEISNDNRGENTWISAGVFESLEKAMISVTGILITNYDISLNNN